MSRVNVAVLLGATAAIVLGSLAAIQPTEDVELRDLDLAAWNCSSKNEATAQSQEARERNPMKNRWLVNLSGFAVESLDTASFLKKVREYNSHIQGKHRGDLTAAQREELDASENQIVSLTGWLVLAYPGPPETTNCGDETFHDWILRFLKGQAITLRRSATRLRLFVRLLREQSGSSTVTVCAFSRSPDFFAYRTRATGQRDTRHKKCD